MAVITTLLFSFIAFQIAYGINTWKQVSLMQEIITLLKQKQK